MIYIYIYISYYYYSFVRGARGVRISHIMTRRYYSRIGFECYNVQECVHCRMGFIPVWEKSGKFVAERLRTGKWSTKEDLSVWGHACAGMVARVTHVVEDGSVIIGWAFANGHVGSILEEFYRVPGNETKYSEVLKIPQEAKYVTVTPYTDFVRGKIRTILEDDDDGSDERKHENFVCPCLQEKVAAWGAQQVSSQRADDSDGRVEDADAVICDSSDDDY